MRDLYPILIFLAGLFAGMIVQAVAHALHDGRRRAALAADDAAWLSRADLPEGPVLDESGFSSGAGLAPAADIREVHVTRRALDYGRPRLRMVPGGPQGWRGKR